MKKINIFIFLVGLFAVACNPNKDIYEKLDDTIQPYNTKIEYTLVAADYTAASKAALDSSKNNSDTVYAKAIATKMAFNTRFDAKYFTPPALAAKFLAYNKNSSVNVTYKTDEGSYFGTITKYVMFGSDYTSLGLSGCFTVAAPPEDYLPAFLLAKYPTAVANNFVQINYKYPDVSTSVADFWRFDGTAWSKFSNTNVFVDNDYLEIGGYVGTIKKFTAAYPPQNYLPQYLMLHKPYAQTGDTANIVYKLDDASGNTSILASRYDFDGTNWVLYNQIQEEVAQFIHNGTAWFYDPTVYLYIGAAEHTIIVNYVKNDPYLSAHYLQTNYVDREFYYGANYKYVNFNIVLSTRRSYYDPDNIFAAMSDADMEIYLLDRINESLLLVLRTKYPNAQPFIDGLPVYYKLTYLTYGLGNKTYTVTFKCKSIGDFELFEGTVSAK